MWLSRLCDTVDRKRRMSRLARVFTRSFRSCAAATVWRPPRSRIGSRSGRRIIALRVRMTYARRMYSRSVLKRKRLSTR